MFVSFEGCGYNEAKRTSTSKRWSICCWMTPTTLISWVAPQNSEVKEKKERKGQFSLSYLGRIQQSDSIILSNMREGNNEME